MSLFGKRSPKGITQYELTARGGQLRNRLHEAFRGRPHTIRDRNEKLLDAALGMTGDKDFGDRRPGPGVTTKEEFNSMVETYEKQGIFSKKAADKLRDAARDALND